MAKSPEQKVVSWAVARLPHDAYHAIFAGPISTGYVGHPKKKRGGQKEEWELWDQ
jgi:hypothetical protein